MLYHCAFDVAIIIDPFTRRREHSEIMQVYENYLLYLCNI